MKKSFFITLGALIALMLLVVPVALAATPQDIYDDYADNGKLDTTYSQEDLQAYLNDPVFSQYGDPGITSGLDETVSSQVTTRSSFPFTGFQLLIIALAAVVLIALGFVLRRQSKRERSADNE